MFVRFLFLTRKLAIILFTRTAGGRKFLLHRVLNQNALHAHPIDVAYGIQTSGFVPNFLSDPGLNIVKIASRENNHYAGCQPSCLRKALQSLPDTTQFVFYDLGCGMGRALVTASEFPFQRLVGVELSIEICDIACKNAHIISNLYPRRAKITINCSDVTLLRIQDDKIVVFMYHSFGPATLGLIIQRLEQLVMAGCAIFIILENPVNGHLFDNSSYFKRWFAEQVICELDEIDHHSDASDGVVVWRSLNISSDQEVDLPNFDIVTTKPTWRAEIVYIDSKK